MHAVQRATFCMSLVIAFLPAQASFVDHGTYSTDTGTGLDWLDVRQTAGISYPGMVGGAGGWLAAGWRYATGSELTGLFTRYIGPAQWPAYNESNHAAALDMIRQLGVSVSFNNSEGMTAIYGAGYPTQVATVGFYNDGADNDVIGLAEVIAIIEAGTGAGAPPTNSAVWGVYPDAWPLSAGNGYSPPAGYGSYLVRASAAVPEPGTSSLIAAALTILGLSRRKSAAHMAT